MTSDQLKALRFKLIAAQNAAAKNELHRLAIDNFEPLLSLAEKLMEEKNAKDA